MLTFFSVPIFKPVTESFEVVHGDRDGVTESLEYTMVSNSFSHC